MYKSFKLLLIIFMITSATLAQEQTRDQKIQSIHGLRSQISALESDILKPDASDIVLGQKQGFNVIRLLPREKYDRVLAIRGGGAYYSFSRETQEYGRGSDIALEQGYLSVGFAGADYGFLIDLGKADLADVTRESPELDFLVKYAPPQDERSIRAEYLKFENYQANGYSYKRSVTAAVGHTYALRSIVFSDTDILVALKVERADTDGSLIVFWKPVMTFAKPIMNRQPLVSNQ